MVFECCTHSCTLYGLFDISILLRIASGRGVCSFRHGMNKLAKPILATQRLQAKTPHRFHSTMCSSMCSFVGFAHPMLQARCALILVKYMVRSSSPSQGRCPPRPLAPSLPRPRATVNGYKLRRLIASVEGLPRFSYLRCRCSSYVAAATGSNQIRMTPHDGDGLVITRFEEREF